MTQDNTITESETLKAQLAIAVEALVEVSDPNVIRTSSSFKMIARSALQTIKATGAADG